MKEIFSRALATRQRHLLRLASRDSLPILMRDMGRRAGYFTRARPSAWLSDTPPKSAANEDAKALPSCEQPRYFRATITPQHSQLPPSTGSYRFPYRHDVRCLLTSEGEEPPSAYKSKRGVTAGRRAGYHRRLQMFPGLV